MSPNRSALAREIEAGLAEGAFEPVFQPIARLSDGALAGFEALARWRRPDGTLRTPAVFLETALAHDLMGAVSRRILFQAVETFARWRAVAVEARGLFLSVNMPGGDLERGELVGEAIALAQAAKLPPGALRVEITEQQILKDPDAAAAALTRLRAAGVAVAFDDFGSGFGSLAWLSRLPVDTLKIDRSFILGMLAGDRSGPIVRAVIALAHELGLDVVAEGVETAEARDRLSDMGCDYAQGHLFAPALGPDGAEALIATLASAEPLLTLS